jgi:hypothetical protein
MRKRYLVIRDIKDCKNSPGSYVVVSSVELSDTILKAQDVVPVPEQVAAALREAAEKHAKPER